jgi:hypothetical protein
LIKQIVFDPQLKKSAAILALLCILLQTFSQVVIVLVYYANKDFIAKNLCENRDKPKMHCEGKCCLKKKLAKEGKEQAPSTRNQKSEEVALFFYSNTRFEIVYHSGSLPRPAYYIYNDLHTSSFHHSVFRPPSA